MQLSDRIEQTIANFHSTVEAVCAADPSMAAKWPPNCEAHFQYLARIARAMCADLASKTEPNEVADLAFDISQPVTELLALVMDFMRDAGQLDEDGFDADNVTYAMLTQG